MIIKMAVDADVYIEAGDVVFVTYDPEGDVQFKDLFPLYEMVAKMASMYEIPGTGKFKLTDADIEDLKTLQSELDDSLTLISSIIEENS